MGALREVMARAESGPSAEVTDFFGLLALLICLGVPAVVTICRAHYRSVDNKLYRSLTGCHGEKKIPDALEERTRETHRSRVARPRKKTRRDSTKTALNVQNRVQAGSNTRPDRRRL